MTTQTVWEVALSEIKKHLLNFYPDKGRAMVKEEVVPISPPYDEGVFSEGIIDKSFFADILVGGQGCCFASIHSGEGVVK